jgi:outer membrane protein assembly factor BamA
VVGGIRGTLFFNIGGAWYDGTGYQFFSDSPEIFLPLVGYFVDENGLPKPVYGDPVTISGFRLRDGRASYGVSLSTFAFGIPMHFDWSWRTLFNKTWSDALYGSDWRKPRFQFWIGYDF